MENNYCTECGHSGGHNRAYCFNPKFRNPEGTAPVCFTVRRFRIKYSGHCPEWAPRQPLWPLPKKVRATYTIGVLIGVALLALALLKIM
jgi:hypothetical protein